MPSFEEDFEWQKRFTRHFGGIAQKAMRVQVAPAEEDWKRNTDFVLSTIVPLPNRDIRISARARRRKYVRRYADEFTVRLDRPSGMDAEMPKIKAGWGDFTIYGFESESCAADSCDHYPTGHRLGPWFIGNVAMLRDYIGRGGYWSTHRNTDYSSRLAAFHHADMPLGFVLDSDGLSVWDDGRVWELCRRCWWGRTRGGFVSPTDDDRRLGTGYGRFCLACGFWWRAGWEMSATNRVGTA
jgi:hypothetical protein